MRRAETFQIASGYAHGRECDRQLRECRRFERAPWHREQLERRGEVGDGLRADRIVRDQQRRQLGDLGKGGADGRCIGFGTTGCDAGRPQGPSGVLRDARQRLGEFQCF